MTTDRLTPEQIAECWALGLEDVGLLGLAASVRRGDTDDYEQSVVRGIGHAVERHIAALGSGLPPTTGSFSAEERGIVREKISPATDGRLPERETHWLIERKVSPPQYLTNYIDSITDDVWHARRFPNECTAYDYWRMMPTWLRDDCRVVEHMFINKTDSSPVPASQQDEAEMLEVLESLRQAIAAARYSAQADGGIERQTILWLCADAEKLYTRYSRAANEEINTNANDSNGLSAETAPEEITSTYKESLCVDTQDEAEMREAIAREYEREWADDTPTIERYRKRGADSLVPMRTVLAAMGNVAARARREAPEAKCFECGGELSVVCLACNPPLAKVNADAAIMSETRTAQGGGKRPSPPPVSDPLDDEAEMREVLAKEFDAGGLTLSAKMARDGSMFQPPSIWQHALAAMLTVRSRARRGAMEEAAAACDGLAREYAREFGHTTTAETVTALCAKRIRSPKAEGADAAPPPPVSDPLDRAVTPEPIPMFLTCPKCNARHIDEGEFATKVHHTHSCQSCGLTWRPAIVPTVGVQFLPGFKNVGALEAAALERSARSSAGER